MRIVKSAENGISVILASMLLSLLVASPAWAGGIPQKNVNAIGPTPIFWLYAGNPRMQQNEPEGVVSPNNPEWLALGFNDYRAVNDPTISDAFPGIAMSRDGGRTWISGLHPEHLADIPNINKKFGADANLEAVPYMMYYNFIAGWRDDSQPGGVYLSRWYEHNREVGPPWEHLDTLEVATGTAGRFLDKPAFDLALRNPDLSLPDIEVPIPAYSDPRNIDNSHDAYVLRVPAHRVHLCFAVFVGNDNNDGTKINCLASDDGGVTWPISSKITESVEINQGVSLATRNFGQDVLAVWTRFQDNNESSAIMFANSTNFGNTWSKAKVLTEFCPFNQSTGAARHRTNALPVAASNGSEFSVYFAARNDATETCLIPAQGNNPATPRMSDVSLEDDFDGPKDGQVRTSLNFSRIMMVRSSGSNNLNWTLPEMIDPQLVDPNDDNPRSNGPRKRSHQYMPAVEAAGGIETLSWYDSRFDKLNLRNPPIAGGFVEDLVVHFDGTLQSDGSEGPPWTSASLIQADLYGLVPPPAILPPAVNNLPLRRTLDVFAAQIVNGEVRDYSVDANFYPVAVGGVPSNSTRVSRFATRKKPGTTTGERQQIEWNYPNARLFRKGRAPFIGDYKTVFAAQARQRNDGRWIPNKSAPAATDWFSSDEPVFHVGWTSNHEVRGKVFYTGCDEWDEGLQMWVSSDNCANVYTEPNPGMLIPLQGEDGGADGPAFSCSDAAARPELVGVPKGPLTRNQNIFTAAMKPGINVDVLSAIKDPDGIGINTFALGIQNGSNSNRRVRLDLPAGQFVSFDRNTITTAPLLSVEVQVPRGSGNARTVFDIANGVIDPVVVEVFDVTALIDPDDPDGPTLPGAGTLVARVPLLRESLTPLENVQNNDPDPDSRIDILDPDGEFYELILKRETGALKELDLENLDLENSVALLDLENLDLENLDLENQVVFLDLENLDLENLDLENDLYSALDLENNVELLDLENLDLENRLLYLDLENLDLENLDLENLDLENLDLENLDLENLDLENLDLENVNIFAADLENLDLENLDLENSPLGEESLEISWTADSGTNTTTGVDIKPIFSPPLATAIEAAGTTVVLTVRQTYLNSTVALTDSAAPFCSPQIVAQNQIVYAAVLRPDQINELFDDPEPSDRDAPSFIIEPDGSKIITLRFINPPDNFDTIARIDQNTGMAVFAQPGGAIDCEAELGGNEAFAVCEIDYQEPDITPPVITVTPGPASVDEGTGPYADPGASALDDRDGNISSLITVSGWDGDTSQPGEYTIFYDVMDAGGNPATTESRTVTVNDITAPVLTLNDPVDQTVEAGDPYDDPGATANDNFDPTLSYAADSNADQPGVVNTLATGSFTVTYTASDAAGNNATPLLRTVIVEDTTPPVIVPITVDVGGIQQINLTVEAGTPYDEPGAVVTDNASDDPPPVLTISVSDPLGNPIPDVDTSVVGEYTVHYNAIDYSTNPANPVTRTVTVVDITDPVFVTPVPLGFIQDEPFVLPPGAPADATFTVNWEVGAQDLEAGLSVSCRVIGPPPVPISLAEPAVYANGTLTAEFTYDFPPGSTYVDCTVTDQGGNTATSAPFVVLVEDIPVIEALDPTLTVPTDDDMFATVFEADLIANIMATDRVDGDLSGAVSCQATDPQSYPLGENTITCSVTDSGGYSASTTFTLDVIFGYDVVIKDPKGNINSGSSLPIDFFYKSGGQRVDSSTFDVSASWVGPYEADCSTPTPDFGLGSGESTGSSDFRYSASQKTWQFNWQTEALPGCYKFTVSPPGNIDSTIDVILN